MFRPEVPHRMTTCPEAATVAVVATGFGSGSRHYRAHGSSRCPNSCHLVGGGPGVFSAQMSQCVSCLSSTGGSRHSACLFATSCMMTSAAKFQKTFFFLFISFLFRFFWFRWDLHAQRPNLETDRENSSSEFHICQICVCVCQGVGLGCFMCTSCFIVDISLFSHVQRHHRFPVDPLERSSAFPNTHAAATELSLPLPSLARSLF